MLTPAPGREIAEFLPLVEAEAEKSWAYRQQGALLDMHYTAGSTLPVHSRWRCESQAELERLLADYPMVKAGLLEPQVFQLAPYVPLERLRGASP